MFDVDDDGIELAPMQFVYGTGMHVQQTVPIL